MGLERIAAVLQHVHSNYEIDLFQDLIRAAGRETGVADLSTPSLRVIADHIRACAFLIVDGVIPGSEGRGYVLRRIARRALRHGYKLGQKKPFFHRLVEDLDAAMGDAYPELRAVKARVADVLRHEEERFGETLEHGMALLEADLASGVRVLDGETAFKLYDTYGFPYDLTEDALRAQGFGIDREGFDAEMAQQKERARAAWKGSGAKASDEVWFDIAERVGSTEFTGYTASEGEGQVMALVKDGAEVQSAKAGDSVTLITNQTPFYGESGGQMGDAGSISSLSGFAATVNDTSKPLGRLHAHQLTVDAGEVKVGDVVQLKIDTARRDALRSNHSATHLLHAALRNRLGGHVTQKGSLVAPDRLRFDFSHNQAVSPEEIADIEAEVNAQIRRNTAVTTRLMAPDEAVAAGALALFGEKYGDEVRVLSMGDTGGANYSVELCGGTHVNALGDIALMTIVSEGAVASGIRRIEALTGEAARQHLARREGQLKDVASLLKTAPDEVAARVETLLAERRALEKELSDTKTKLALSGGSGPKAEAEKVGDTNFMGQVIPGIEPKALRGLADEQMKALGGGVVAIIAANENANTVVVAVSQDLVGKFSAPDLVRAATAAMGGQGGGGRPEMAQGGGPAGSDQAQAGIDAIKAVLAG